MGKILDTIYPPNIYCIMCGSVIDESRKYSLCDSCIQRFIWAVGKTCRVCGRHLPEIYTKDICPDCMERPHHFDRGYTCAQYGLYERNLIVEYKKRDKTYIGKVLGEILYDRIVIENLDIDGIISVPIHKAKLKERGYNQAEIMAAYLAKNLGVKYYPRVLERKVKTIPMKKLGALERIENLRGVFSVNERRKDWLNGKSLLLVDDIYTTGATRDECSLVLKENGAKNVYILTFAAGSIMVK